MPVEQPVQPPSDIVAAPPPQGKPMVSAKPSASQQQRPAATYSLASETVLLPIAFGLIAFGAINAARKLARSIGATKLVTGYPLSCDLCSAFWASVATAAAWLWMLKLPLVSVIIGWAFLLALASTGVALMLLKLLQRLEPPVVPPEAPEP